MLSQKSRDLAVQDVDGAVGARNAGFAQLERRFEMPRVMQNLRRYVRQGPRIRWIVPFDRKVCSRYPHFAQSEGKAHLVPDKGPRFDTGKGHRSIYPVCTRFAVGTQIEFTEGIATIETPCCPLAPDRIELGCKLSIEYVEAAVKVILI